MSAALDTRYSCSRGGKWNLRRIASAVGLEDRELGTAAFERANFVGHASDETILEEVCLLKRRESPNLCWYISRELVVLHMKEFQSCQGANLGWDSVREFIVVQNQILKHLKTTELSGNAPPQSVVTTTRVWRSARRPSSTGMVP